MIATTYKMLSVFSLFALAVISCTTKQQPENPHSSDGGRDVTSELTVTWEEDYTNPWKGGYGRIHRLNDGRLMAVYESGACGYAKFSSDNGRTWGTAQNVLRKEEREFDSETVTGNVANPEFAQLSASNPHHPGRIIYAGNIRPSEQRSDLIPYSICLSVSDDNGKTWTKKSNVYESQKWERPELKGCWEPFVLELPDGTVQIYFADETPYFADGLSYQNISVVESKDGGDTWGKARIVAYTEKYRDGMPVLMVYEGNIYLAIEHFAAPGEKLHPQIVYSSVASNWKRIVKGNSEFRFDPFLKPLDYRNVYAGAPYLAATDNYIVLSYQSSEGAETADTQHAVMEVVVCHKDEFVEGTFPCMRAASRPMDVDQTASKGLWNSLCPLGGDEILAVSNVNGFIKVSKGTIKGR